LKIEFFRRAAGKVQFPAPDCSGLFRQATEVPPGCLSSVDESRFHFSVIFSTNTPCKI